MLAWFRCALGVLLLVSGVGRAVGQGENFQLSGYMEPPDYDRLLAAQPPGLSLKITLPKDHFYQGEIIEATLTYGNEGKEAREVTLNTIDRSGRAQDVRFFGRDEHGAAVDDPVGWIYLHGYMGGGAGWKTVSLHDGGTGSVTLTMNQWLRFDHPGTYTVYAVSTAVESAGARRLENDPIVSDKITLTITPLDPAEEKRIVDGAVAKIDEGYRLDDGVEPGDEKARKKAYAVEPELAKLRYLQSPLARAALRAGLDRIPRYALADGRWDVDAGLYGAPDRPAEAALILADVRAGRRKADENLAAVYTTLKTYPLTVAEHAAFQQGLTSEGVAAESKGTEARAAATAEIFAAAREASPKTGANEADLIWEAFLTNPFDPANRAPAATHQMEFSHEQKLRLLSMVQTELGIPVASEAHRLDPGEFLPVARQYVGDPAYNADALTILVKARPEEARDLIVRELKNPEHHYLKLHGHMDHTVQVALLALPRGPIPEMAQPLDSLLWNLPDLAIQMVERYGTPALLPDLLDVYGRSAEWGRDTEVAALRFWIRTDARAGLAGLRKALQDRSENSNYQDLLRGVFADGWVPEAQPVVLDALRDPSAEVARSAMSVLLAHGDAACAEPILKALDRLPPTERPRMAASLLGVERWTWSDEQKQDLEKLAR